MPDPTKKVEEFIKSLDTLITKHDFVTLFSAVLDFVKELKKRNITEMSAINFKP